MKRKRPADLDKAGRELWDALQEQYDLDDSGPLLAELCRTADRLAAVRKSLRDDGLTRQKDGRTYKHPLSDLEPKLAAVYGRLWKLLGLSESREPIRDVGRPPGRGI